MDDHCVLVGSHFVTFTRSAKLIPDYTLLTSCSLGRLTGDGDQQPRSRVAAEQ